MRDPLSDDLRSLRIDRSSAKTTRSGGSSMRYVFAFVAVVGAAAGVAVVAPRVGPIVDKLTASTLEVTTTQVSLVSPSTGGVELSGSGYVVPQVTVKVAARTSARIDKVMVKEGSVVHVNDELFRLDPASVEAKIGPARARVAAARASAAELHQRLKREKQLLASGAVSPASVEDLAAKANVLDAQVVSAKADLDAVLADRKDLAIRSTIDGRAVTRPAAVGDVATPDKTLVELMDFQSLVVEVDVPEGKIEQVKQGSPAEIILDAYPSKHMEGEVLAVNPKINRAKGTGTVKVKFKEVSELVLPEMSARVNFLADPVAAEELNAPPKKVIPAAAVVDRGGEKVAFTIQDGHARRVSLKLGPPAGGGFEVLEGPQPGTPLILSPPDKLADGEAVKLKEGS